MANYNESLRQFAENQAYIRPGGGISVNSGHPLDRMFIPQSRNPDGTFAKWETQPFENWLVYFENRNRAYDVQDYAKKYVNSEVQTVTADIRFVDYSGQLIPREEDAQLRRGLRSLSTSSVSLINSTFLVGEARNQQNREFLDQEKYESASFQQNLVHAVIYASREVASDRFVESVFYSLSLLESAGATTIGGKALKLNAWIAGLKNNIAVNRALAAGPVLQDVIIPQPFTDDIHDLDRRGVDALAFRATKDKKVGFIVGYDAKSTPGIFDTEQPLPKTEILDKIYQGIDSDVEQLYLVDSIFQIGPIERPSGLLTPRETHVIRTQVRKMDLRDMDVSPENMEAYLSAQLLYDIWKRDDPERMSLLRNRVGHYGKQSGEHEAYIRREVERLAKVKAYAHKGFKRIR